VPGSEPGIMSDAKDQMAKCTIIPEDTKRPILTVQSMDEALDILINILLVVVRNILEQH
jgi:hypothetical protein